jgi:hypothetical protein
MPTAQIYHTHDSRLNGIAIVKVLFGYSSAGNSGLLSGVQLNSPRSRCSAVHIAARNVLQCAVGAAKCYDVWSIADDQERRQKTIDCAPRQKLK